MPLRSLSSVLGIALLSACAGRTAAPAPARLAPHTPPSVAPGRSSYTDDVPAPEAAHGGPDELALVLTSPPQSSADAHIIPAVAPYTYEEEARWPATVEHDVRLVDSEGAPIASAHVTLAPGDDALAARNRELNPPDLWTDASGVTTVRRVEGSSVVLSVKLPLAPAVKVRVGPHQRRVLVRGLTVVRCRVQHFPGYTAVALRGARVLARYEWPMSDALRPGPIVVAWPAGAERLVLGVSTWASVELHAPGERCVLR